MLRNLLVVLKMISFNWVYSVVNNQCGALIQYVKTWSFRNRTLSVWTLIYKWRFTSDVSVRVLFEVTWPQKNRSPACCGRRFFLTSPFLVHPGVGSVLGPCGLWVPTSSYSLSVPVCKQQSCGSVPSIWKIRTLGAQATLMSKLHS